MRHLGIWHTDVKQDVTGHTKNMHAEVFEHILNACNNRSSRSMELVPVLEHEEKILYLFRSTTWWFWGPTGPIWRAPPPRTITRTSRPRMTKIWRLRHAPRRARTRPPTHKDKRAQHHHPSSLHTTTPHPLATTNTHPFPPLKQTTSVMFDSPKTSWFSILFPSAVFIKGCGNVLTPEGKRIESQEKWQAQTEADAFRMGELARGVELRYSTSVQKRLFPRAFGRRLVNVARLWWPRALSQHSLSTHSS